MLNTLCRAFDDGLIDSDEPVASSKKNTQFKTGVLKLAIPYLRSIWPETSEKKIPLRGTHTYIAYIREYPPVLRELRDLRTFKWCLPLCSSVSFAAVTDFVQVAKSLFGLSLFLRLGFLQNVYYSSDRCLSLCGLDRLLVFCCHPVLLIA